MATYRGFPNSALSDSFRRTTGGSHGSRDRTAEGFFGRGATRDGATYEGWAACRRLLALAAIYDGATRSEAAKIGGVTLQIVRDWFLSFQRRRPEWPCRSQGAGTAAAFEGRTSRRAGAHGRGRPNAGDPWRRALADRRSLPMAVRGVPHIRVRNDHEPRAARHGLSQALRAAAPSCAARRRDRRVQKNFPARLEEIAREKGVSARDNPDDEPATIRMTPRRRRGDEGRA